MYILGEQIYFWNLKKLIRDLRTKTLADRAQLYYLGLMIVSSPVLSLIGNLDELWGIEWYCALSWLVKLCVLSGLLFCYRVFKTNTKRAMPNNFLSCLIALSWVVGFRIFLILFTGLGLLSLLDQCTSPIFSADYLLYRLNLWVNSPFYLIFGIIILNLVFFGLVNRALVQVVKNK